jgi:hypothetical protein
MSSSKQSHPIDEEHSVGYSPEVLLVHRSGSSSSKGRPSMEVHRSTLGFSLSSKVVFHAGQ